MNNKKGTVMVEAAFIYPLIIGVLMTVVYIIISMYTASAIKTNIHLELRQQSMTMSYMGQRIEVKGSYLPEDKYGKNAFNKKITVVEGKEGRKKVLYGRTKNSYKGNSLIFSRISRNHESSVYIIDEADYIRKADMVIK